jgi:outer membrane protein assembly factor BamE (lipoprotein component of BamABCDE complex)
MKPLHIILLAAIVTMPLSGCTISINDNDRDSEEGDWEDRQKSNAKKIQKLELGRTISSIKIDFGEPDLVESFRRDTQDYKVLFYRTQHAHSDGMTTRDETTPLVFVDDVLVGWGESAVEKAAP